MSFHVVRPRLLFVLEGFLIPVIFLLLQQKYVIPTTSLFVQRLFHSVCIHAECIPSTRGQEMMWVRQYPHVSAILMASTYTDRKNLVCDERTYIPNSEFSPIQVLVKLLRIVFPIPIQQMGDHTSFVQDKILSHDFGHVCRGRRNQTSGHSDFGILSHLRASSNFT